MAKNAFPEQIKLKAFLLSVTPYEDVKASRRVGFTKQDFAGHKILFIENSKEYLLRMFEGVL